MLSEGAAKSRDKTLRRRILFTLNVALMSPRRGLSGRALIWEVEDGAVEGSGFENEGHAVALMRDLVNKGLITEEAVTRRKGQVFGPDFMFLRITDLGSRLLREEAPVDPDVDDERISE